MVGKKLLNVLEKVAQVITLAKIKALGKMAKYLHQCSFESPKHLSETTFKILKCLEQLKLLPNNI